MGDALAEALNEESPPPVKINFEIFRVEFGQNLGFLTVSQRNFKRRSANRHLVRLVWRSWSFQEIGNS